MIPHGWVQILQGRAAGPWPGQWDKALEAYRRALQLHAAAGGAALEGREGALYHRMASLFQKQGHRRRALELYGRSRTLKETAVGPAEAVGGPPRDGAILTPPPELCVCLRVGLLVWQFWQFESLSLVSFQNGWCHVKLFAMRLGCSRQSNRQPPTPVFWPPFRGSPSQVSTQGFTVQASSINLIQLSPLSPHRNPQ